MNISLLKKLSEADGPPGFEDEIRSIVLPLAERLADSVRTDRFGNVIAVKRGKGPRVLLSAHMDEVAFIVTRIEDSGLLRFFPLGSVDARVAYGQRVRVITENGKIEGVIGAKAPHLMLPEEEKKPLSYDSLYIDVGASSREEATRFGVRPGVPATFSTGFVRNGNRILGKAFDDRVGVFVLLNVLEKYEGDAEVVALFSAQEEVGLRGARVHSLVAEADYVLALECTAAADTPDAPPNLQSTRLGKGPAITVADRSLVADPRVVRMLVEAAESLGIPYQFKEVVAGGTDAGALQYIRGGVGAGVVSVPARYIHSATSVADIGDIENTIKLILGFLEKLSG